MANEKMYVDAEGHKIPARYVSSFDKNKERFVNKTIRAAKVQSRNLAKFKKQAMTEADKLYAWMLKENNIKASDRKGNYSLTSFDKNIKVEVKIGNRIEFDDHISLAQEKINEFLALKTKDADQDLAVLVNSAFQSNKGRLDTKRVLGLFSIKITHKLWKEAMDLVTKSIQRNTSKRYLMIWEKDKEGEYQQIQLNFSSI